MHLTFRFNLNTHTVNQTFQHTHIHSQTHVPFLHLLSFVVFDYSYRDYILSWYHPLSRDEGQLYQMLSEDFWEMMKRLRAHLAEVDVVNVVCNNTVKTLHGHFCNLKAAKAR